MTRILFRSVSLEGWTAGLLAAATGFAVYVLPQVWLEELVTATALPQFVAAAQPLLGETSRLSLAAAGACLAFMFAWLGLRSLDRLGRPGPTREVKREEPVEPAPASVKMRLRRRDLHPDAPPRPPLLVSELEERCEPPAEPEPAIVEIPLELDELELEVPAEPANEFVPEIPIAIEQPQIRSEPAYQPEPSLAELAERFERGLAQRRRPNIARGGAPSHHSSSAAPNGSDVPDRLQSAIDSLHRLAARSG